MTFSIQAGEYTLDDVPESWLSIVEAFNYRVVHDIVNNGMPDVYNVVFSVRYGLLQVTYQGGNAITDAYAAFARSMSGKYCKECGALATRDTFGEPKCNDCV